MGDGDIWAADEERKARSAGWVLLADVLDAVRDRKAYGYWLIGSGRVHPNASHHFAIPREDLGRLADYLAERFAPTAPEGADERSGHV